MTDDWNAFIATVSNDPLRFSRRELLCEFAAADGTPLGFGQGRCLTAMTSAARRMCEEGSAGFPALQGQITGNK
jgi:hypothetical protein